MSGVHRNDDLRTCGAKTIVNGQTNVFANSLLISVDGDPNTHGNGNLIASCNNVFINNKMVVDLGDGAVKDDSCDTQGGSHCSPSADSASPHVFVGD